MKKDDDIHRDVAGSLIAEDGVGSCGVAKAKARDGKNRSLSLSKGRPGIVILLHGRGFGSLSHLSFSNRPNLSAP